MGSDDILGLSVAQYSTTKSDHATTVIFDGEHDAAAKSIVEARCIAGPILTRYQPGSKQLLPPLFAIPEGGHQGIPGFWRVADAE